MSTTATQNWKPLNKEAITGFGVNYEIPGFPVDGTKDEQTAALEAAGFGPDDVQSSLDPEPTFSVSRLVSEAEAILRAPSHVVAGALAGESPDAELTVSETRDRVEKWLGKKDDTPQTDNAQED